MDGVHTGDGLKMSVRRRATGRSGWGRGHADTHGPQRKKIRIMKARGRYGRRRARMALRVLKKQEPTDEDVDQFLSTPEGAPEKLQLSPFDIAQAYIDGKEVRTSLFCLTVANSMLTRVYFAAGAYVALPMRGLRHELRARDGEDAVRPACPPTSPRCTRRHTPPPSSPGAGGARASRPLRYRSSPGYRATADLRRGC